MSVIDKLRAYLENEGYEKGLYEEAEILNKYSDEFYVYQGISPTIAVIIDLDSYPERREILHLEKQELQSIAKKLKPYTSKHGSVAFQFFVIAKRIDERFKKIDCKRSFFSRFICQIITIQTEDLELWTNGLIKSVILRSIRKALTKNLDKINQNTHVANYRPYFTYITAVILLITYILQMFRGGFHIQMSPKELYMLGGSVNFQDLQWENFDYLRLLMSTLLHGSLIHIFANMYALIMGGLWLETLLGPWWFGTIYIFSALFSSLGSCFFLPKYVVSVGASGAIMGIFGALIVLSQRYQNPLKEHLYIASINILLPTLFLYFSEKGAHTDHAGHLGGMVSGSVIAVLIYNIWPKDAYTPRFKNLAIGFVLCSLLVLLIGFFKFFM